MSLSWSADFHTDGFLVVLHEMGCDPIDLNKKKFKSKFSELCYFDYIRFVILVPSEQRKG